MTTRDAALSPAATEAQAKLRPFTPVRWRTIAGAHALHDTYSGFLPPLLPKFIELLSLTKTEAGLLSVFMQAPSLFQPVIGHLADQVNLRWIVVLAPAVTMSLMSWLSVAPTYLTLAVILTLVGVSSAGMHAVGPVMAGRLSGRNLGRGMAFWMVGGELGRTLGPIVVVSALGVLGLRGMPWLMAFGLAASLALWWLLRDVTGRPQADHGGAPLPWRDAVMHMRGILLPLVGIIAARAFATVAVTTFLPTYLTDAGASLWFAGASLSVLEAAGVVGALTGGSLSDRLGRRTVLAISMAVTPLFLFAFLAVGGLWQLPLLLLLGFTLLSTQPAIMAMVQETYAENRSLANGLYMAINFIVRSVIVVIVGVLGDAFGLRAAFVAAGLVMLVGIPVLRWLPAGAKAAQR